MSHNKETHNKAAGTYEQNAKNLASDQRALEAQILLKSNRNIQQLVTMWDTRPDELLEETLKYNRNIWMLFYDTALEDKTNSRPDALRGNIVNLANFIFKREMDILASPEKNKLEVLISINREIAQGLMENSGVQNGDKEKTP